MTSQPHHPYISYTTFLKRMQAIDIKQLATDERNCTICYEPLSNNTTADGKCERGVLVHDKHIVGELCIKKWLSDHDTCPCCRRVLFSTRESMVPPPVDFGTTDECPLSNLRKGWSVLYEQAVIAEPHPRTRDLASYSLYTLYTQAASYLATGQISVPQHYQRYEGLRSRLHIWMSGESACIDSERSIHELWVWWSELFSHTNRDGCRTYLHHPWATALLFEAALTLNDFDGSTMSYSTLATTLRLRMRYLWRISTRTSESFVEWAPYMEDLVGNTALMALNDTFIAMDAAGNLVDGHIKF